MRNTSFARRRNGQGFFFSFCGRHEFNNILGRIVDVDHKHFHVVGGQRHRHKIFLHVVGELRKQRRINGCCAHTGEPQSRTIGFRLDHFIGTNGTTGAGFVFYNHRSTQGSAQRLSQCARHGIYGPACSKSHNDSHRLGIGLRNAQATSQCHGRSHRKRFD